MIQNGYTEDGKITVFDNCGEGSCTYSSIHMLYPVILIGIFIKENNHFLPSNYDWSWEGNIFDRIMKGNRKSGA